MRSRFLFVAAFLLGLMTLSSPASAAFVLTNTNGGNGYVITTSDGFTLVGSNNNSSNNYTYYINTTAEAVTLTFTYNFTYTTYDKDGAEWDPAGYIIGGTLYKISLDSLDKGESISGVVTLTVLAGQTYGFYVYTLDGKHGAAQLSITNTPLPAALPLFGSALLGMAAFTRKRRA